MVPRHTGRGLVIKDGKILLMERWRGEDHYFSIPGGGIEVGETAEQAAVREIMEETGVTAKVVKPVCIAKYGERQHYFFLCEYITGEPHLPPESEEASRPAENNRYLPRWVSIEEAATLPFGYWEPIREWLLYSLNRGFSDQVMVVSVIQSR